MVAVERHRHRPGVARANMAPAAVRLFHASVRRFHPAAGCMGALASVAEFRAPLSREASLVRDRVRVRVRLRVRLRVRVRVRVRLRLRLRLRLGLRLRVRLRVS